MNFGGLFNPDGAGEKAAERRECERVRQIAWALVPEAQRVGLHLNVSQVGTIPRRLQSPLNAEASSQRILAPKRQGA
jgi:hypothetical protein